MVVPIGRSLLLSRPDGARDPVAPDAM